VDVVTQLAIEARSGDASAIASFVRATQQDVWRLCSLLGRRGEADDLTQETFLRVLRSLPQFRADSPAKMWVLGIARRTCADDFRVAFRTKRLGERLRLNALVDQRPVDQSTSGISAIVAELDDERREAFVLTQVIGLSYDEAAEVCGCPTGTIRSRVARARQQLTQKIRDAEAI
jgi:RNA polymerase sigma-70 factor (ECF subfamily)